MARPEGVKDNSFEPLRLTAKRIGPLGARASVRGGRPHALAVKGRSRVPILVIVGAPNVGKSRLFNRLVGRHRAIVTDEPGATRDRLCSRVEHAGLVFDLVDTGGLASAGTLPLADGVGRQVEAALAEAAAVLFVVDVRAGPTAADRAIADRLRRIGLPVVLVANKVDDAGTEPAALAFHALGLGEPVPVSAEHGRGLVELLEAIERLPVLGERRSAVAPDEATQPVRLALVGRPNVGKSSLVNRLAGEDRVLVAETPGTTRDAVDVLVVRDGRRWLLVDTAGLRRPGRVRERAEAAALAAARRAIARANVVALVLDAVEGIVAQDTRIAGAAFDADRPLLFVVNKWDLVADRAQAARRWATAVRERFRFAAEAPLLYTSARTGQRVTRILDAAAQLHEAAGRRIGTAELNRWLRREAERERSGPAGGGSVNLLYAAQLGVHPPRFVVFCSDPRRIHFSLRRRLIRSLQERFGFRAVPLRLTFRGRRRRQPP